MCIRDRYQRRVHGDGYKGDYYYKLTLHSDAPESIRGKVYEIGISLNESCFDKLPGYNDPTASGYHDYKLKIPPIKFGIPYGSGDNAGKVFYSLGYSTDITLTANMPKYWEIEGIRRINDEQIHALRTASGDTEDYVNQLAGVWNTLDGANSITFSNKTYTTESYLTINMSSDVPTLPIKAGNDPDVSSFGILLKTKTSQLASGTIRVISNGKVKFNDFANKAKSASIAEPLSKTVSSKGAWMKISYTCLLYTSPSPRDLSTSRMPSSA
eukprot:TRINITY_DN9896_c0_g1_i6.p1 TRINITY_DN9896_c0_g1~~TRINITY_DN9896_c0_g1_i6.p1  ORF type:complete len:269 (+),score=56.83 TRINITY_DN9896_c0_g1_i6:175-981(+)